MVPAHSKSSTAAQIQSEIITGTVARRIFFNAKNGYVVLSIQTKLGEEVKASGYMSSVREGDEYQLTGSYSNHPKYGQQFKFSDSKIVLPTGKSGVARYLSGVTYGVGAAKAQKIVESLGEDCLELIKEQPDLLSGLDFLTETQRAEIAEDLCQNSVQAELAGLICREGIGRGMVTRIYNRFGPDSVKMVKENPYVLADELWGVGFKRADVIAQTVGIAPNSPYRVEAALSYTLGEAANEGHVFLTPNHIVHRLIGRKGLLEASGVSIPDVATANNKLISDGRCIREGDFIYSKSLYVAECNVARSILGLLEAGEPAVPAVLSELIAVNAAEEGMIYAPEQFQAIKMALTTSLSVVTGGPGVGKTTVINTICNIYAQLFPNRYLYLAAPTGRAAKRMYEATGREAKTIHRLLRYSPAYGGFEFDRDNPLPGPGLLIVDESSMIDIELMASLLGATTGSRLQVLLVGDIDQLPSVGPGSVLRDLITSGVVPVTRLKFNYRQAGGSKIAEYANLVCQGITPPLADAGDFEFIPVEDADRAAGIVATLVRQAMAHGRGPMDFQVLAPMRRGSSGVTALNDAVREIVNPASDDKPTLGRYRLGDKVMVIKNNYALGVFNGDLGIIVCIAKGIITVDFGGAPGAESCVDFAQDDLELLTLAYATTIHKSQGSEFPIVFMPLTRQHYMMLQRNLLYTGMTRAKEQLILIADEWSVKKAVSNNVIEERFSLLAARIRAGIDVDGCHNQNTTGEEDQLMQEELDRGEQEEQVNPEAQTEPVEPGAEPTGEPGEGEGEGLEP